MSIPTLYYFNLRGRAEATRILLHYLKVQFNDTRVERPLTDEVKAITNFGQVPHFVDPENNFNLSQSFAIETYIAEKYGLGGKTLTERALINQFVNATNDIYTPYFYANDEASNLKFRNETGPKYLSKLEQHLKNNGGEHFVSDRVTQADLAIYTVLDFINQQHSNLAEILTPFPTLIAFHKKFASLPQIAQYLATRPVTRV